MKIMYHGTTKENAERILKDGFSEGTYFARHLEDSLYMGGDYIFEVYFKETPNEYWEYVSSENIPTSRIRTYYKLKAKLLWHNKDCEQEIRKCNIKEDYDNTIVFCEECDGKGQMEYYPPFMRWRDIQKVTVCKKCSGHGCYNIYGEHVYDHKRDAKKLIGNTY